MYARHNRILVVAFCADRDGPVNSGFREFLVTNFFTVFLRVKNKNKKCPLTILIIKFVTVIGNPHYGAATIVAAAPVRRLERADAVKENRRRSRRSEKGRNEFFYVTAIIISAVLLLLL